MLVIAHPPGLEQERRYVLEVVLKDWLNLAYQSRLHDQPEVHVTLAGDDNRRTLIMPDVFMAHAQHAWLQPASIPSPPLEFWQSDLYGQAALPVLFKAEPSWPLARKDGESVLPLDLFGSIFFLLSRYEEAVNRRRDRHDRFPANASVLHQQGLLDRPLANEYLEVLWSALQRLWPRLQRRPRRYEVRISHDVDVPFACHGRSWQRVAKSLAADLVHRRSPGLAARRLASRLTSGSRAARLDPHNCFEFIMATSERLGLASTFYIKAGASDPHYDDPYALDRPPVAPLLQAMHRRGHELGLHPSYHTYQDASRLRREFQTLRDSTARLGIDQPAWGGRQHYLRFATPATWRHYAACGLSHDATLGLAEQPGFRSGSCYDFDVYDVETRTALPLRERPLIVMEGTLLDVECLGLSHAQALAAIERLAAICRRFGGIFSLLWHNNRLITKAEQRLYQQAVEAVAP